MNRDVLTRFYHRLFPNGIPWPTNDLAQSVLWYLLSVSLCLPVAGIVYFIEKDVPKETSPHDKMKFIEALYISFSGITTIGFGDIHCSTTGGRMFIITFSMVLSLFHSYVGFRLIRLLFFAGHIHQTQPPDALVIHKPTITLDHLDHIDQALRTLKTEVATFRSRVETLAWSTEAFLKKINDIESKQAAKTPLVPPPSPAEI